MEVFADTEPMWRILALLFVLSIAGRPELKRPPTILQLPEWANPEPREVASTLILDRIDYESYDIRETPFSDVTLAAILSNTLQSE